MTMFLAASVRELPSASFTSTLPGAAMRASPTMASDLFFLSRNSTPLVSSPTTLVLCAIMPGRSSSTDVLMPSLGRWFFASSNRWLVCSSALDGMQPILRQVPPKVPRLSMQARCHAQLARADRGVVAAGAAADDDDVELISHGQMSSSKALRVFEVFLHAHQERHRFAPIDQAVIVGQRQIHHRADFHLVVDGDGARLDLVHAQNARLRRIQNRRGHQRAEHAAIGDGEGAALQFFELQIAVARARAEIVDGRFDPRQLILSASRTTGTTRPFSVETATPMS